MRRTPSWPGLEVLVHGGFALALSLGTGACGELRPRADAASDAASEEPEMRDAGARDGSRADAVESRDAERPDEGAPPDGKGDADDAETACAVRTLGEIAGGSTCPSALPQVPASPANVDLWIESGDGSAGQTVRLTPKNPVMAGGHTYTYEGDGLFGTGGENGVAGVVIGSIDIDIDGTPAAVSFNLVGCVTGMFDQVLTANVTRRRTDCPGCSPETVVRTYNVVGTFDSPDATLFEGTMTPSACGFGFDLTRFELE